MIFNKRSSLAILSFFLFSVSICAQDVPVSCIESILPTSDRTHISFGQGFGNYKTPHKTKPLTPLVFEGQLSPGFFVNLSKKRAVGLTFFPKVVIRMYHLPSFPVRTPSYMPNLLFYHKINRNISKKIFKFFKYEEQQLFMTYRVMHHSNGQEGTYFIPGTDSVNYKDGNFSTNAVEIAFSWSIIDSGKVGKAFTNGRISYERQLEYEREPEMRDLYYYNKASLEYHIIYSEKIKLYFTYAFMWGTPQFKNRNSVDLFISLKPFKNLADFSIFMRGYIGPDYYNLYYENILRAFTVGFIVDPLSIPVINRLKKKKIPKDA